MTYQIAILPVAFVLVAGSGVPQTSNKVRPEKKVFENVQAWPATKPGDVKLKNFRPFRAVYERHYSGRSGELRIDRVIMTAERVGWDGRKAALITLIDAADAKWDDTAARHLFSIVDATDMSLLFESGPIPGKAKDYYFMRPAKGMGAMVTTDKATLRKQEFPPGARGFGPGPWVLGSMELRGGLKIRLDPFLSPAANIFGTRSGIVKGKTHFEDVSGGRHPAWLLESGGNLAGSRMGQIYVTDRPPYFLARFSLDLDTGKETRGIRLIKFQLLD